MTHKKPTTLRHVTSRGKVRDWRGAKLKALATAQAYRAADADAHGRRAERIAECANRLEFIRDNGLLRLRRSYSCKNRLCPVCQGMKARQEFAILLARVMAHATRHPYAAPILLTLTVPNVDGPALKSAVGHLLGAFRKLVRMAPVTRAIIGWHRALEITVSVRGDFHPHIHSLLFVRNSASYFAKDSPLYLTQARWAHLWKTAAGLDRDPIVWVTRLGRDRRDGTIDIRTDGLFEVVKYVVAPDSLYAATGSDGWTVEPSLLATIHEAVRGRRLRDVGGSLRAIKKTELPNPRAETAREAAHTAIEAYEFEDWFDADGELHGFDYWARAPPPDTADTD